MSFIASDVPYPVEVVSGSKIEVQLATEERSDDSDLTVHVLVPPRAASLEQFSIARSLPWTMYTRDTISVVACLATSMWGVN